MDEQQNTSNGALERKVHHPEVVEKTEEPAALWVDVAHLKAWDKNPRDNDKAVPEVMASIKRFGFAAPIIARPNGEIIAGHTRLKAALELRLPRVPVRYMDLDPAEAHLLALADNRVAEIADWNDDLLSDVLRELEGDGVDLKGIGWDVDELAELLGHNDPLPMDGSEDEVPEVQAEVHSKAGEVYELGPHRLMCGDCRAQKDVSALLDGVVVNMAFTSPPYASQRKYDETSGFKPIKPDAYVEWFDAVQANVREYLAEDGSWFVNIKEAADDGQKQTYVKRLTIKHVDEWGWKWIEEFCWPRPALPLNPNMSRRFKNGWESVYHFAASTAYKFKPDDVRHETDGAFIYADQKAAGKMVGGTAQGVGGGIMSPVNAGAGLAFPSNVLSNMGGAKVVGHSAAFPVGLPAFFVKAFSDEGDTILDPFMGSGTTLIAAAQERRVAYGMEISPGYCDVIRRRWTRWAHTHNQDPGSGALEDA